MLLCFGQNLSIDCDQSDGVAVFNFTVEGNHNYFILAKDYDYGQACVLVHNKPMRNTHLQRQKFGKDWTIIEEMLKQMV